VVGFRSGVGFAFDLDVVLVYIRFGVWFSIWLGFGCGLHLVFDVGLRFDLVLELVPSFDF